MATTNTNAAATHTASNTYRSNDGGANVNVTATNLTAAATNANSVAFASAIIAAEETASYISNKRL